ncbi:MULTISPECIES: hypothetical protein [unclassified Methanoregula]|uniref:hypothetical protein n=1 Tax=unclassified Methanoregula TaxID=2649730 RepID=UPI0009C92C32|nr:MULTISPECIES: hypothetical protein [unclassified Methanoregula]OPX62905.1 MAG: hypothetical protein A4E33_02034 [Methanoregula sp. PtaB.Bin085]OPY35118.1 MAG: hypothetical protein A4E34_00923 [Methanoregula sp. PtaU1.Bin006]
MTRTVPAPIKKAGIRIPAPAVTVKNPRAPVQILRSTKDWLDQIITEKNLRSYDEAIMFLIQERQRHMPSDFGVFSDLEPYTCNGED